MEMKKGSRATGIGKGSAPKKRCNRTDKNDQNFFFWKWQFSDPDPPNYLVYSVFA